MTTYDSIKVALSRCTKNTKELPDGSFPTRLVRLDGRPVTTFSPKELLPHILACNALLSEYAYVSENGLLIDGSDFFDVMDVEPTYQGEPAEEMLAVMKEWFRYQVKRNRLAELDAMKNELNKFTPESVKLSDLQNKILNALKKWEPEQAGD